MKQFFKFMFASFLGTLLVIAFMMITMIIIGVSSVAIKNHES